MKRSSATMVALVLALGTTPALAQEHGEGHPALHPSAAEQAASEGRGERGGEAHSEEAGHEPDPINYTTFGGTREIHGVQRPNPPPLAASIINFALLLGILFFAVRRSINPALAQRRTALEEELNEARRLREEAEALKQEYVDKLATVDAELAKLVEETERAGKAEFERVATEARARAEKMRLEGEQTIAMEFEQLKAELTREVVEAAVATAEATVKKSISGADQSRMADEYLASLEKQAAGASA